jgi:peptidoglycan hydrolase CwlO-like protein
MKRTFGVCAMYKKVTPLLDTIQEAKELADKAMELINGVQNKIDSVKDEISTICNTISSLWGPSEQFRSLFVLPR